MVVGWSLMMYKETCSMCFGINVIHLLSLCFLFEISHWGAKLVKPLILDVGSGHDLEVCEFKPSIGLCTDSMEPASDSVSSCLCSSSAQFLSASLPLEINK